MVLVFISHSKDDTNIRNFFGNIINSIEGFNSKFMEFETIKGYPALFIEKIIGNEDVKAVFVLLGSNITKSPYTQNWVAFEVGMAKALKKDIWVFEEFNTDIKFPIPYLDFYMMYTIDNKDHFDFIRSLVKQYKDEESLIGILFRLRVKDRFKFAFKKVICPNPRCNAFYYLLNTIREFKCPVCREPIHFKI